MTYIGGKCKKWSRSFISLHILIFILETDSQDNALLSRNTDSKLQQLSDPSRGQFKCYKPGIYPDVYDCKRYYKCIIEDNGQKQIKFRQIIHTCGSGKIYSYIYEKCMQVEESERPECTMSGN